MRIVRVLLIFAIAVSARAQDWQALATNLRVGESINGFPSWSERVILEWMNRARVDPQKELAGCGSLCADAACYKPNAPLMWIEALNHSARFHTAEMAKQGYFAHDSKCAVVPGIKSLYPVACDGSASCACTSGLPTIWNARVALFGEGPSGEIIAGTGEPNAAFYLWMYEPAASPSCGFGSNNGHRVLIFTSAGGVGVGVGSTAVADFGGVAPPYKIPSAAHYPKQADTVTLWANWYDASAPKSASAVVDGKCSSMSLQRGTPQNGAWSVNATGVGSGCHRYYFSFIDSTNVEVTYPATGSLGIGDASCEDWNASRMSALCSSSNATPTPPSKRRAVKRH